MKKINLKRIGSLVILLSVLSLGLETQVFAAATITVTGATVTGASTVSVTLGNLGADTVYTADATKWHIVSGALTAASVATTSSTVVLTFSGTPFSAKNTAYATSAGLYVDAIGVTSTTTGATNVVSTSTQSIAILDGQAPTLSAVTMVSNNASTTLAKVGNIVTVYATSTESINTPTVTIDGVSANVTGSGTAWMATTTMTSGNTTGALSLSISFTDLSGNAGTPVTSVTSGVAVTLDKTPPTFSAVTMVSNNASTTVAIGTNIITLSATTSETISTPTITIFGRSATVTGSGSVWVATSTVSTSTDTGGSVAFSISAADPAGNAVATTTVTSSVKVFFYALPLFTMNGGNPVSTPVNHPYTDLSASVTDSRGVTLTMSTVSTVNTATIGAYTVSYGAVDSYGNAATSTRTVNVVGGGTRNVSAPNPANYPTAPSSASSATIPTVVTATSSVVTTTPATVTTQTPSQVISTNNAASLSMAPIIFATIKKQLKFGLSGSDVKLVQLLLSKDQTVYPEGLTTGYFGNLTQKAVQKFQEKYNIASKGKPGYGEVGPKTKAKLVELYGS